jgi:uncharacterized protein Usg
LIVNVYRLQSAIGVAASGKEATMAHEEMRLRLMGFRPTLAEILYRLPDHPALLQSFVWQQLDRAPEFPRLRAFLAFWRRNLDGQLYSVRIAAAGEGRLRLARTEFRLH